MYKQVSPCPPCPTSASPHRHRADRKAESGAQQRSMLDMCATPTRIWDERGRNVACEVAIAAPQRTRRGLLPHTSLPSGSHPPSCVASPTSLLARAKVQTRAPTRWRRRAASLPHARARARAPSRGGCSRARGTASHPPPTLTNPAPTRAHPRLLYRRTSVAVLLAQSHTARAAVCVRFALQACTLFSKITSRFGT